MMDLYWTAFKSLISKEIKRFRKVRFSQCNALFPNCDAIVPDMKTKDYADTKI